MERTASRFRDPMVIVLFAAVRQRLFPKNSPRMEPVPAPKLLESLALPTGIEPVFQP
jgi:hypothetical protein